MLREETILEYLLKEKIIKRIIYFLKWEDEKIININLLHYLRDRPKDSRQAVAKKKRKWTCNVIYSSLCTRWK